MEEYEIDINDDRFEDLVWEWLSKRSNALSVLDDLVEEYSDYVFEQFIDDVKKHFREYAESVFFENIVLYVAENSMYVLDELRRKYRGLYDELVKEIVDSEYDKVIELVIEKMG